jgi:hypothetical protein
MSSSVKKALTPDTFMKEIVMNYMNGGQSQAEVISEYGPISEWDTSLVEDMSKLFENTECEEYGSYVSK